MYVPPMTDREPLTPGPNPSRTQCHCATCKQTFSGITLFDQHRRAGRCRDPRDMKGLRLVKGVWRMPATPGQYGWFNQI